MDKAVAARIQLIQAARWLVNDLPFGLQSIEEMIHALISDLASIGALVPLTFIPSNLPHLPASKPESPLFTTYWVSDEADPYIQEIQGLLKAIYRSFTVAARICMNALLNAPWPDISAQSCFHEHTNKQLEIHYLR